MKLEVGKLIIGAKYIFILLKQEVKLVTQVLQVLILNHEKILNILSVNVY